MSRRVQPLRRKNIRSTIKALGQGTLPGLVSRYWPRWVAGERKAARVGKKIAADLDRNRKPASVTKARQYRIAKPGRTPNPPLPAKTAYRRHQAGKGTDLGNFKEEQARRGRWAKIDAQVLSGRGDSRARISAQVPSGRRG